MREASPSARVCAITITARLEPRSLSLAVTLMRGSARGLPVWAVGSDLDRPQLVALDITGHQALGTAVRGQR
jgi:hypothetical protein